ncbi:MAG: ABC transporter permease, partial [Acidobacteriota bacterium]
ARHAAWRPSRSALSLALVAFACFVIVSVGAFRKDPVGLSLDRASGTGGYALMAESVAPLMHDPNRPAGREELGLPSSDPLLDAARITRFRLRPGDDASCLTLYRPLHPRIVAPEAVFLDEPRFAFAASLAETPEERANPWRLLARAPEDGTVPAIVDQTTLTYVFHAGLGDEIHLPAGGGEVLRLRVVGVLADAVFQSEIVIGEAHFVRLFPRIDGYRIWMIETPEETAADLAALVEARLGDLGVDVVDTRARLAAYHRVENTYLSTFQALGGLGLLLGTLGLGAVLARNVLERRRELGLLGAVGFTPAHLRTLVLAESAVMVWGGMALGAGAAALAIAPAIAERGQALPWVSLAWLLAGVGLAGMLAALGAVRMVTATATVVALKGE